MLSPDRAVHGVLVLQEGQYETIRPDVVLPVLHGSLGEDGAVQGSLAYIVAASAGIATPGFRTLMADEVIDPNELNYPVFVKPARSGSSFGVNKVGRPHELADAVAAARRYDSKVLIEDAVVGSEVGCAVLGNRPPSPTASATRPRSNACTAATGSTTDGSSGDRVLRPGAGRCRPRS